MELAQCLNCILHNNEVCGISCKDQNVICDRWCIEKLQNLSRILSEKTEESKVAPPALADPSLPQDTMAVISQLTETIENGTMSEKKPEEKTYLDMVTDLYAALDSDSSLPEREKDTVIRNLKMIQTILWKYSA